MPFVTGRCFIGLALLAGFHAAMAAPAAAQTAPDVFDINVLHEVRLFINSRDLALLRERYQDDSYYPADFSWSGIRTASVAVRSRGSRGSRSPDKLHLRVDFNRYASGQTFLGLRSLILKNLVQQPSMITEQVALAVFDRMGEPVPRESFCRLYINDVYQGVYSIVESVDEDFLARTLGRDDGFLFSFQFELDNPFWGADLGDDYAPYRALFEAETHEMAPDAVLYGPVRELFRQVNAPFDGVWRSRVEEYLDLRQFVTHVAIEACIAEIDGLLRLDGMNNFFLHRRNGDTRHRLLVWDKDRAFSWIERPILLFADENEVLRRALAFQDLWSLYLDVLEQCARTAQEGDWLLATIERLTAVIADAAREDPLKPYSNEEFEAATEFLRRFARERPAFVLGDVAAHRLSGPGPADPEPEALPAWRRPAIPRLAPE